MGRLIGSLGFDAGRLGFAFRTALAAALAVMLAWALGLEHPQWAGMSTWAAAQPIRGQLLEKSFFRVAGTVVGAAAGVGLILAFTLHPWLLVAGLSLWVGFCTWLGNLQRGFVAYGAVLAGYSAAMVALLETTHPGHVLHLAGDRVATALTGVAVATLLGWAFARPADGGGLRRRVGGLVADLLDHAADPAPEAMPGLLARLAALDETLDPHAAGRLRGRREVRAMRSLLLTATELLFASEGAGPAPAAPALRQAAAALREGRSDAAAAALRAVAPLHSLAEALADPGLRPGPGAPPAREAAFPVILHRDRVRARESALRATGGLLLAGAFWQVTGWEAGAFLMLGLSVMVSLFSTFEDPGAVLPHVWLGQICGVLAALACRWLVWPLAGGEAQLILMMVPFILIGPLLMAHRRTGAMSFDYNMGLLLMLQPHWPLAGSLAGSLQMGLAVIAAPLAAIAAYRWIYPAPRQRRQAMTLAALRRDLADLAARPPAHPLAWRARLFHRCYRLARFFPGGAEAAETGLALYRAGLAVVRGHALRADPAVPPAVRRAAEVALARAAAGRSGRAAAGFERLAGRLAGPDRALMRQAARAFAQLA